MLCKAALLHLRLLQCKLQPRLRQELQWLHQRLYELELWRVLLLLLLLLLQKQPSCRPNLPPAIEAHFHSPCNPLVKVTAQHSNAWKSLQLLLLLLLLRFCAAWKPAGHTVDR